MEYRILPFALAASALAVCPPASALNLGLEASARIETSDNVSGNVTGTEENGQIGYILLGVFAEQRGRVFEAGFSGELETRQVLSNDDAAPTTLNSFFGAANVLLTPTFSWYFGNVLGTVQTSDELLSFEDENTARRNVFVTGPSLNFNLNTFSSFNAELLYFNQSQNDVDLAQLVTARLGWRQDTQAGNTFGIDLSNIYTDEPELDNGQAINSDTNRASASVFWERSRALLTWYASLGGTRFQTEDEGINGVAAELRLNRRLGPRTDLIFSLGTDITNENIATIDSLLDDGSGLLPDAEGVFQSHLASLVYSSGSTLNTFQFGVRASASEFQLVNALDGLGDPAQDDNVVVSTFGVWSRRLPPQLNLDLGLEFENQRFTNVDDDIDSIRGNILLSYQINQSFRLSAGLRSSRSSGINTRDNQSQSADGSFETVENRALLQLTWAPPSRATQEPVVQLKQLLR